MIYNEVFQWLFMLLIFWQLMKHERTLNSLIGALVVLNKFLQTIKEAENDEN